jgi:universal stress protein A
MALYRHILLVVDLSEDSLAIARKGTALAQALGAQLALLHVVEFVPVEPMGETLLPSVQMEDELIERSEQRLKALATELGLDSTVCRVESGNVKSEIVRVARERKADLIILGSREAPRPVDTREPHRDTVLRRALRRAGHARNQV